MGKQHHQRRVGYFIKETKNIERLSITFFSVFAFEGNRLPVLSIHLFTKERSVDEAARNTSIKGNAPLKIIGF